MTGVEFARKEVYEILRTWRIWVLPGIVLFFAISGPLLARFTPEIVGALVGNSLSGLKVPTPTYSDSYIQWIKNLSQILLIAVIIVYGGLVSGEVRSGTVALVLTKPLSRNAFITVKAAVHSLFLAVVVMVGALLTWGLTWLIFGTAPGGALWNATVAFLALGVLFVCVMTLLSSLIRSSAGAAGAGLGAYIVLAIAAIWRPLDDYSPAGLTTQPASLAAGKDVTATWPIATALVLAIALVALAGWIFRRQDL
ncbi:MAG TPA: ABC transporter permease subunit [Candidatus Dormibacteraeota bacterium]